jgi:hypothetical protein
MTQSTASAEPTPRSGAQLHTSDILMNLIVAFLAPMFLAVSGGNIDHARAAAIHTMNAYRIRNHADLIAIAQIVAFGLAVLASLSQSMADGISLPMTLRLRTNANALNRSAERTRRALTAGQASEPAPHHPEAGAETDLADAAAPLAAALASSHRLAGEARARLRTSNHTRAEAPLEAPAPAAAAAAEKRHQAMWAIAMVKEAQEITASIPSLPPAERPAASIRAAVLSSTANEFLTGVPRRQTASPLSGVRPTGRGTPASLSP